MVSFQQMISHAKFFTFEKLDIQVCQLKCQWIMTVEVMLHLFKPMQMNVRGRGSICRVPNDPPCLFS